MTIQKLEICQDRAGGYRLQAEMKLSQPIETVFGFFSDALKLQKITPPWLHFSVLTPPPIEMRSGLLLDYRLWLHRIPITWRTEIVAWDPPFRFVDQQVRGPYQQWIHEHTFANQDGQTLVVDNVHYIPRGGRLIHKYFVQPDLERIFNFRQTALAQIFNEISIQATGNSGSPTVTV